MGEADVKAKEASDLAAAAHWKNAEARKAEMQEVLVDALRDALRDDGNDPPLLLKRIPLTCRDIGDIKNDLKWLKRIAAWFCGVLSILLLPFIGWVSLQVIANTAHVAAISAQITSLTK